MQTRRAGGRRKSESEGESEMNSRGRVTRLEVVGSRERYKKWWLCTTTSSDGDERISTNSGKQVQVQVQM